MRDRAWSVVFVLGELPRRSRLVRRTSTWLLLLVAVGLAAEHVLASESFPELLP